MNDTERLICLETWLVSLPNTILRYNNNPEIEDHNGTPIPVGFSVFVSGYQGAIFPLKPNIVIVAPTFRGLIDMMGAGGSHSQ